MFELTIVTLIYLVSIAVWRHQAVSHQRRISKYQVRIHVNGIRGKSTVTRLIGGVLREGGYQTLVKTTGSEAVIIEPEGNETPINRPGIASVKEQMRVIAGWEKYGADAIVMECMALQPKYQAWSENVALKAHIGVITNVREDHQEIMGETLSEIAVSLSQMCPHDGYLVTAETNPELLSILRNEAQRRNTELIVVDPDQVTQSEIERFDYVAFKENIAIGLAIAQILNINRAKAMQGMLSAKMDVGALRLENYRIKGKEIEWANLFAVNDRESTVLNMDYLDSFCDEKTIKIGILNNRYDREWRAKQFSDIVAKDLSFDWLITFGAYEELVTKQLCKNGFPAARIINMGFSLNPTIDQIIERITNLVPDGYRALLVGFVNIHTPQAELLLDYFEGLPSQNFDLIQNKPLHTDWPTKNRAEISNEFVRIAR